MGFFKTGRRAFLFVDWAVVVTDMLMIINRTEGSQALLPDQRRWRKALCAWPVLLRQKHTEPLPSTGHWSHRRSCHGDPCDAKTVPKHFASEVESQGSDS